MGWYGNRKEGSRSKHLGVLAPICLFFAVTLNQCGFADKMPEIIQEPLPYPENALEPYISAATMRYHYGKHHAASAK